ncbi:MAG: DUF3726 domain-containing protein [Alphaproteobacteria bacterium]|nr:MAG: DUF3726 domain-containing protein [Alphaproteobacteria bacterium]
MTFSLGEVEAVARKAARGAGYSWGMAEEAGRAARWLCAAGLDGAGLLAEALAAADGTDPAELAPRALDDWRGPSGRLCPLMAGAALSDAVAFWKETGVTMAGVTVPALVLPFAAMAARASGANVTVRWADVTAVTDGRALSLCGAANLPTGPADVSVSAGGAMTAPLAARTRATPRAEDWAALNALAARTYAPATEESRMKGAGAGLTDND